MPVIHPSRMALYLETSENPDMTGPEAAHFRHDIVEAKTETGLGKRRGDEIQEVVKVRPTEHLGLEERALNMMIIDGLRPWVERTRPTSGSSLMQQIRRLFSHLFLSRTCSPIPPFLLISH